MNLSVSELLRGRRLTPEELPKAAGEQVVDGLRKSRLRLWQGVIAALLAVALVYGIYCGYHYAVSASADDQEALAASLVRYKMAMNITKDPFNYAQARVVDLERQGKFLVAMLIDEEGHWDMVVYERDRCFSQRWYPTSAMWGETAGHTWTGNYIDQAGNGIYLAGGWDLPEEIAFYTVQTEEASFTVPARKAHVQGKTGYRSYVMNVFIIPVSTDHMKLNAEFLDSEKNPIHYTDFMEPDLTWEEFDAMTQEEQEAIIMNDRF